MIDRERIAQHLKSLDQIYAEASRDDDKRTALLANAVYEIGRDLLRLDSDMRRPAA